MQNPKRSLIFESVLSGDLEKLRHALASQENINSVDQDGRTALFYAATSGRTDLISELIRNGSVIDAQDNAGKTPLHLAVIQWQVESVKMLLESGAKVDSLDFHGNSPLSDAVFYSQGKGDLIRLLLDHGANPVLRNKYGVSPKELAETISNYDVRQFFN